MHLYGHHHHLKRHNKKKPPAWLDKPMLVLAVAAPLSTLPQMYEIYFAHSAEGVSVVTWGLYTLSSLIWMSYARVVQNRPLTINCFLWAVLQGSVMVGAIIY